MPSAHSRCLSLPPVVPRMAPSSLGAFYFFNVIIAVSLIFVMARAVYEHVAPCAKTVRTCASTVRTCAKKLCEHSAPHMRAPFSGVRPTVAAPS